MMRTGIGLALAVLLAAGPAQAQKIFRCADERGRTFYTEKPGPNCKPTRIDSVPADAPVLKAPVARTPPKASSAQTARLPIGHCDSLSNDAARLSAGTAAGDPAANSRRLAGIQEALKDCGR